MKKSVLRYGGYSAAVLVILFVIGMALGEGLDYGIREVIGYASIILSLLFVFLGIKHYRDQENNGLISFGKGLVIGLLISVIASLAFGLIDLIYVRFINPEFVTEYYNEMVEQVRATVPAEEVEAKIEEMEAQREMFSSPAMSFMLMFLTVFVIGFIVSIISALILQRKTTSHAV